MDSGWCEIISRRPHLYDRMEGWKKGKRRTETILSCLEHFDHYLNLAFSHCGELPCQYYFAMNRLRH